MSRSDLPAWIRLYVNMPDELADLSDRAFRVIVRLWCYSYRSGEYGTDGIVPKAIIEEYARGDLGVIDELVAARLLDPVIRQANEFASRFACANYTKWQESAAQRAEMRAKKQSAGSKGGKARAPASAVDVGEAPAQAPAQAPAKQNASKTQAEIEIEKEKNKELRTKNMSAPPKPRPDVDVLSTYLADKIEANGSKRPTVGKRWHDACRLMLDVDKRSPEQIRRVIDFSQADDFWRVNILSMPKLREKFDALRLGAERANGARRTAPNLAIPEAWR